MTLKVKKLELVILNIKFEIIFFSLFNLIIKKDKL